MRFPTTVAAPALLLISLLVPACGPADVEGTWTASWPPGSDEGDGATGKLSLSLTQDDDTFEGTFNLEDARCIVTGLVEGSIDRRSFVGTLQHRGDDGEIVGELKLDGTVSTDSDSIAVDFVTSGAFCEDGASGSFDLHHD